MSFWGRALSFVDHRAERIIAHLTGAGYARCEPPILQPASIFFDSGEDLRAQLYLTSDVSGADYCLRPEYTIPVLTAYLASASPGAGAAFCYCGPVFRFRPGQDSEFTQAGIENFGRPDREAADAEILTLALDAAASAKPKSMAPRAWPCGSAMPGCFRGFSKRSICRRNGGAASRAATVRANPSRRS